jgi:hypothetical protein
VVIFGGHFRRSFREVILGGHFRWSFSEVIFGGHFGRSFSEVVFGGRFRRSFSEVIFGGHFRRSFSEVIFGGRLHYSKGAPLTEIGALLHKLTGWHHGNLRGKNLCVGRAGPAARRKKHLVLIDFEEAKHDPSLPCTPWSCGCYSSSLQAKSKSKRLKQGGGQKPGGYLG